MNLEQRLEQLRQLPFPELAVQPDVVMIEAVPVSNKGMKRVAYLVPKEATAFLEGKAWVPSEYDALGGCLFCGSLLIGDRSTNSGTPLTTGYVYLR